MTDSTGQQIKITTPGNPSPIGITNVASGDAG
jgi:hypothetical protein